MRRRGIPHPIPGPESVAATRAGFTLIELMIVLAIIATLVTIGMPVVFRVMAVAKETSAAEEMRTLQIEILAYLGTQGKLPDTLDDVGMGNLRDPWGNLYQYLVVAKAKGKGKLRKDRFLVPINSDFDLYSMGPNGKSVPALTAKASQDDIIRANDGGYFGLASEY